MLMLDPRLSRKACLVTACAPQWDSPCDACVRQVRWRTVKHMRVCMQGFASFRWRHSDLRGRLLARVRCKDTPIPTRIRIRVGNPCKCARRMFC